MLGFEDVLLAGLARDGGLYVPQSWPQLSAADIASLAGRSFAEVAVTLLEPYVGGAISTSDLLQMANKAYAGFGSPAVTPLVQIGSDRFVLELFHGPTLAFKDVAMQLLARLMEHVLERRGEHAMIVGATSGDTGGAAIEAFRGSAHADVVILYPQGRVSDVQRRMMTTPVEPNVHAVAVEGTFDDCQALVKGLFNDHAFRDRFRISGVNSINWGRIMAQITYYFAAAVALGAPARAVSFAVPTGNFGDIFAGYAAKRMGLPIERLIIATNDNDILRRAHASGTYEVRIVVPTFSPSMDIQVSSNFERYLFEATGRDAPMVRGMMESLRQSGRFSLGTAHQSMQTDFDAASASGEEVAAGIRALRERSGYLMDPHTACGFVALEKSNPKGAAAQVVLATADPAKFPDSMELMVGERPQLPARLRGLMTDRERTTTIPGTLGAVQDYVESVARVGKAAA